MEWMIYGANGYTGRLMVEEAVRRGLRPVLAGRSRAAIEQLATEFGLPALVFGLESPDAVADRVLAGIAAGRFLILPTTHEPLRWRLKRFLPEWYFRMLLKRTGELSLGAK